MDEGNKSEARYWRDCAIYHVMGIPWTDEGTDEEEEVKEEVKEEEVKEEVKEEEVKKEVKEESGCPKRGVCPRGGLSLAAFVALLLLF